MTETDKKRRLRNLIPRVGLRKEPTTLVPLGQGGKPHVGKVLLGVLVLLATTLILEPDLRHAGRIFDLGDVAPADIKAPADLLVEDAASSEKHLQQARAEVLSVYDFDSQALRDVLLRLDQAFAAADELVREEGARKSAELAVEGGGGASELVVEQKELEEGGYPQRRTERFQQALGFEVDEEILRLLEKMAYPAEVATLVGDAVEAIMAGGVTANPIIFEADLKKGIVVRDLAGEAEEVRQDVAEVPDLAAAQKLLAGRLAEATRDQPRDLRRIASYLGEKLIVSNLSFNRAETEERLAAAVAAVAPVYFQIKKGEMIVREGARITADDLLKLEEVRKLRLGHNLISTAVGLVIWTGIVLFLGWVYLAKFKPRVVGNSRQLLLLSAIFVTNILIVKVSIFIAGAFAEYQPVIPLNSFYYAIPFAVGSMLVAILFDLELAVIFTFVTFGIGGILLEEGLSFPLVALAAGLVASFRARHYRQRSSVLVTGLWIGLAVIPLALSSALLDNSLWSSGGLFDILLGFAGGVVTAVIVSAILPIVESAFDMTTDIKLLELSDLNHPLLRELLLRAPGTYHHSVIVGHLAEAAAESVAANSLFARVSSYYHDIGKMRKPEYFIENQGNQENKHDSLTPSMSSLILLSHVKDGVELAREYKLAPAIIDIIRQHHGTTLITYFYDKACKLRGSHDQPVKDEDYRYPGPRPQSREAAIVMMADAVEAASRALWEPSPSSIRGLVRRIVNNLLMDGQLDECDLTLRGLNEIVNSFVRILMAIFHHRVSYPAPSALPAGVQLIKDEGDGADHPAVEDAPARLAPDPKPGAAPAEGNRK